MHAPCDCALACEPPELGRQLLAVELEADCDAEFGAAAACELDFAPGADADPAVDAGVDVEAAVAGCAAPGEAAGAALAAAAALFAASISASVSTASGKSIAAGFGARSISLVKVPKPNCEASMR